MNTKQPRRIAALMALALAGLAQAKDDTTLLDTLVVTGTRTQTSLRDSPASVSIVGREEIEKRGTDSVAELLRDVPGVSVVDSAVAGMKRIRIRGEQSNRVVILVDGQELTDHSSFGSPLLVDPANIERIEVVRGPASVLYGAKAIGGVVNIITRKGAATPVQVEVGGAYHSATRGWEGWAAVSGTADRLDYRLSVSGDDHGDRKVAKSPYSASGRLENSSYQNQDVSLHAGLKLDEAGRHYVALKANHHHLKADGWQDPFALVTLKNIGINPTIAGKQAQISIDEAELTQFNANLPKRDLDKVGLYYEGKDLGPVLRKASADLFVQRVDREFNNDIRIKGTGGSAYIPFPPPFGQTLGLTSADIGMNSVSVDRTQTYGASGQLDFSFHPDHYTLMGAQFLRDDLDTNKSNTIQISNIKSPSPGVPTGTLSVNSNAYDRATMQTASAFVQDEWSLTPDFKLIGGLRYYRVESTLEQTSSSTHNAGESSRHGRFVKALGLTWTGLEHSTVRAGYSEGYVMPSLLEQFTDSRAGRGIVLSGNPDLLPERSKNYELGLRYQNRGVVFDGTLFFSRSKNYITFESCSISGRCAPGGDIYVNADRAKSHGVELLMEYLVPGTSFTPYFTGTWMRRQITVDDFSTYQTDVPRLSGRLGLRWEDTLANSEVWADLFVHAATAVDKKERAIEKSGKVSRHLAGWGTLNFAVGSNFGPHGRHRVVLHMGNLLDKGYRASVDEMPGVGRNVVLTFSTRF
ncbi:TonB-dependent receptor domain-containing protein [Comamonas faecalis]